MTNCFLQNSVENKCIYFREMAALSTSEFISIDHTFQVAANLGYLRPDSKWVSLHKSLFIVLNNIGQVMAWQLTQSTSTDEAKDLLASLVERLKITELSSKQCMWITRVLSKRHPLYTQIIKDIKLLFRDPNDTGKDRTLPTPTSDILSQNLDAFITKWKGAEILGSYILNDKQRRNLSH